MTIDELVVNVLLNASGFKQGTKQVDKSLKDTEQAADRTAKDLQSHGKKAAEFFAQIRNQFIALAATVTAGAGLKAFAQNVTVSDAAVSRMSKNIGLSVEDLSRWQNTVERAGGSAAEVTGTLKGLSEMFQEYQATGNAAFVGMSTFLHVDPQKANGEFKKTTDYILELTKAAERMHLAPQFASYLFKSGGIDEGTIQLMLRGSAVMEEMLRKSNFATKAEADAAERRREQFERAMQGSVDLGRKLLTTLAPAIEVVLRKLTQFGDWLGRHQTVLMAFGAVIGTVAATTTIALNVLAVRGFISLVGAMFKVPAAAAAAGGAIEATAAATAAASTSMIASIGGVIAMLGRIALVAYGAHKALETFDQHDDLGTWMDDHSSLAAWIDNAASKIGLGRSYEEQRLASQAKRLREGKSPAPPQAKDGSNQSSSMGVPARQSPDGQAQRDVDKFIGMGWSREQAAGIVANLQAESGGRADAVGDKGQAFGIAQWHPDRQADFAKWAGKDIRRASRDEQLAFVNFELRQGNELAAGLALQKATDAAVAAVIMARQYERPRDLNGESAKRAGIATSLVSPGPQVDRALLAGTGAAAAVNSNTTHNYSGGNTSTAETNVNIENVNIPNASDAESVAKGLSKALTKHLDLTGQANYGLTG